MTQFSFIEKTAEGPEETLEIARMFGKELRANIAKFERAIVVALYGDLGTGKTNFVKGLAEGFGIEQEITSPTFTLISNFQEPISKFQFYHIDPYRLPEGEASQELNKLGIKEIFKQSKTVVAIEWASRLEDLLPRERVNVYLEHQKENERYISLKKPQFVSN